MAWYPQVRECCDPGERSFRVSGPASICVWAVGMAQIQGTVDGQRHWIHWARQSMASPRWYPARPEVIWARARAGGLPSGSRTPLRTLCGVVGSPAAPGGATPWGEHGVCPFDEPLWAGRHSCSGHYVVVLALENCNPDLRRGVVAVCRWGREVVVWGAEAGGAEGGVAGWCGGLFSSFRIRWVVVLPWGGS